MIDSPIRASLLALRETNNVGNKSGILSIDIKPAFPFAFEEIADAISTGKGELINFVQILFQFLILRNSHEHA